LTFAERALCEMARLLLCFALKEESRAFQKLVAARLDLSVLLTGIGQRNADRAIRQALAQQSPKLVLTCGFAGGLNPELAVGTVLFSVDENQLGTVNPAPLRQGSRISDAPPLPCGAVAPKPEDRSGVGSVEQVFALPPEHLAAVLVASGARRAKFHCADRVAASAEAKRALRLSSGADAVEMESGVIRGICGQHKIPSATVRVISDGANQDLPLDFNRLMDSDQNLRYGKLTAALLKSPGKIGALLKLQKQTRAASEQLGQVLVKVLETVPNH
jgi:nucleoside phosphorylase